MKMLSVSHKPTETIQFFQLWPLTPSVMIRVQQTIEGHEEVTWGQMSSNGVLIRFSPISGDRMEIETCIWCQTTWLVKPLRKMGILTYLGHGLALSWPDLRSNFETDLSRSKVYVSNWLDETNATVSYYFLYLYNQKSSEWKTISVKTEIFHLMTSGAKSTDLRFSLIKKRYRGMKGAPQC